MTDGALNQRKKSFFDGKPPLFLPKGSVRAVLALGTTLFVVTALWMGKTVPDAFWAAWGSIVTFYYQGRFQESRKDK